MRLNAQHLRDLSIIVGHLNNMMEDLEAEHTIDAESKVWNTNWSWGDGLWAQVISPIKILTDADEYMGSFESDETGWTFVPGDGKIDDIA